MGKTTGKFVKRFDSASEYHNARLWKAKREKKMTDMNVKGKMYRKFEKTKQTEA